MITKRILWTLMITGMMVISTAESVSVAQTEDSDLLTVTAALLLHGAVPHGLPLGTYKTTISAQEVPPSFPPEIAGTWEIEYFEGRNFVVWKDGEFAVSGSFTSTPARLIVHDQEGPLACVDPGTKNGVYQWTLQGNGLILTGIRDRCLGRAFVLTLHPLQKQ
jgi:hypothetical protein